MDVAAQRAQPTSGPFEFEGEDGESGGDDEYGGAGEEQECEADEQDAHAEHEDNDASGLAQAHGIHSLLQLSEPFHVARAI